MVRYVVFLVAVMVMTCVSSHVWAEGDWEPRSEVINNMASSAAYISRCEAAGFLPSGTTARYRNAVVGRMTNRAFSLMNSVYQSSLHRNSIYSISRRKWLQVKFDSVSCGKMLGVVDAFVQMAR